MTRADLEDALFELADIWVTIVLFNFYLDSWN